MGGDLFGDNVDHGHQNMVDLTTQMVKPLEAAAATLDGQATGITIKSDVFERTLMSAAGIKVTENYPAAVTTDVSHKEAGTMFIDLKGLKPEDQTKLVDFINKNSDGGATLTDPANGFDATIKMKIADAGQIEPLVAKQLQTLADTQPSLIRSYQTQSGGSPSYSGPGEARQPDIQQPGKSGFSLGGSLPAPATRSPSSPSNTN